jgi:hypothetical protein
MASIISASTTSGTALSLTADTSGVLEIKTGVTPTTAMTIDGSQNVGIGTSSPNTTAANRTVLDVNGTTSALYNISTGGTRRATFYSDSTDCIFGSVTSIPLEFLTGGVERMRIDSSGNLLVGTTSAATSSTLNVVGAGYQPIYVNTTISGGGGASFQRSGTLAMYVGTAGSSWLTGSSTADGLMRSEANMLFAVGNTERMRIDSSGNVGIGTSTITSGVGWSPRLVLAGTDTALIVKGNGGQESAFGTSGGLYLDCLGNSTGTNNNIVFRNTSTNSNFVALERMRIHAGGNVSIGNTTNTYNLDVTGSIRATTYLYASGGSAGHGLYLANGSSNGLISQMSNGSGSTTTYIGNQTITTSSDIRIKNNVRPTERNALELLGQWEIVDHTWNDPSDQCENNRNSRGVWTGVIAQQIQPITPWLVNKPLEDENKDGSKNLWLVDFAYSVPLLVKAIQELNVKVEAQAAEIAALKGAQ